ncbi:MAG: hypothetical protein C0494_12560, partial [Sphingobium sp.]|nr:hypothetical protein [Sphingobium sp.]
MTGTGALTRAERIAQARAALSAAYAADPAGVERFNARMARLAAARKREQQRVDHLVLGRPRPVEKVTEGKRKGRKKPKLVERPVVLEPGIEEAVQVRELWSHKAYGTPETWDRSLRTHDDALIQLHRNGTLDKEQLEWAAQIGNVYRSLEADVGIKVASLEARVDQSRGGGRTAEHVMRVRAHLAYGYWRDALPTPKQMVLDMIVGDAVGYTVAARRYRVHNRKAKRLLLEAINRWPVCIAYAFSAVDQATVDMVEAGWATEPVWLARWVKPPPRPAASATPATVDTRRRLPPVDPAFLNDSGHLREWSEIAAIIRDRLDEEEDEAA